MCSTVKKDPNIMKITVASNNFGTSSSDFRRTFCKYNLKIVSWFFGNSYNRGVYILSLDTIREKSSHWGWWVFTKICGKVVFSVLKCICTSNVFVFCKFVLNRKPASKKLFIQWAGCIKMRKHWCDFIGWY